MLKMRKKMLCIYTHRNRNGESDNAQHCAEWENGVLVWIWIGAPTNTKLQLKKILLR